MPIIPFPLLYLYWFLKGQMCLLYFDICGLMSKQIQTLQDLDIQIHELSVT